MAYSKKVVDKFENTLNNPEAFKVGRFDPKETNVGTGMVGAPACGDVMKLQIKCEPKGNTHIIKDVKFKTYGCGSAIASSSELVEMLIGKTLEEAIMIVQNFLITCHSQQLQTGLIITGKGLNSGNQGPVLKKGVEHWLKRNGNPYLRNFHESPPRFGGSGAIWLNFK